MLYIMESQLTSLLLKPRRPISCLCMSGRGPHPRTPNHHEPRTQTRTSWTASSGTSSRRDAIIVRERLAKPGNLEKLSQARARILVGFHDDTTRRRRNAEATRAATFTRTDNTPAVGHCKSNLPSVFLPVLRIRYQRTSVSPFPHGFPLFEQLSAATPSQKFYELMRDAFLGLEISYLYVLLVFYILHVAFRATLRTSESLRNSYLISAYSVPICLFFSLSTSFQYLTRFSLRKFQICKFHEASHEPFSTCKVAYLCLSSSLATQFSTNFVSIRILWLTSEISYLYLLSFFPVSSCRSTFS